MKEHRSVQGEPIENEIVVDLRGSTYSSPDNCKNFQTMWVI